MMLKHYILDGDNNPVPADDKTFIEWLKETSKKDLGRHVGDDTINGYRVSTVFLALDHNLWGVGPPLFFETMIFDEHGPEAFDYQERCSTWKEAEEQHQAAIAFVLEQTGGTRGEHSSETTKHEALDHGAGQNGSGAGSDSE